MDSNENPSVAVLIPQCKSTIAEYKRIINRTSKNILEGQRLPGENTINPRTRALERAAWRWLCKGLSHYNYSDKNLRTKAAELLTRMDEASASAQRKYREGVNRGSCYGSKTQRQTKRRSLVGLPANWREQICELISEKYPDALPTLKILSVTGARPTELESGIGIALYGGHIYIRITGAKKGHWTHGKNAGHETRTIIFDDALPALQNFPFATGMTPISKTRLDYVIRAACAKLWPQRKGQKMLSAYSFRHATAADLKAARLPAGEIAAFLGHRSEISQSHYGSRAAGNGSRIIEFLASVSASSPIRKAKKTSKPIPKKHSSVKLLVPNKHFDLTPYITNLP